MSEETVEPTLPKIQTAFVVAIDVEGNVYVERNASAMTIELGREATLIEVRRYLSEILMDLQAQASAEYVLAKLTFAAPQGE